MVGDDWNRREGGNQEQSKEQQLEVVGVEMKLGSLKRVFKIILHLQTLCTNLLHCSCSLEAIEKEC